MENLLCTVFVFHFSLLVMLYLFILIFFFLYLSFFLIIESSSLSGRKSFLFIYLNNLRFVINYVYRSFNIIIDYILKFSSPFKNIYNVYVKLYDLFPVCKYNQVSLLIIFFNKEGCCFNALKSSV